MSHTRRRTKVSLAVGGFVFALLLAAIFTLGSLRLPTFIQLHMGPDVLVLWAVTSFLVVNLIVFGFVLARSLLKLQAERRARDNKSIRAAGIRRAWSARPWRSRFCRWSSCSSSATRC